MEFSPGSRPGWQDPGLRRVLDWFGDPIGVIVDPDLGTPQVVAQEEADGHPWAVEIAYRQDSQVVRTRTVRALPTNMRGRPEHDLEEALVNFAADAELELMDRGERPFEHPRELHDSVSADIATAIPEPTDAILDGQPITATRLRTQRYEAVEVKCGDTTIVCLAPAGRFATFGLRTVRRPEA